MKTNTGSLDRIARIAAGCAILGVGIYFKSWWALVAVLPISTALVRFCPLYTLFGWNTSSAGPK